MFVEMSQTIIFPMRGGENASFESHEERVEEQKLWKETYHSFCQL